jgi:iron complex transport system ATP-binding protein
MDNSLLHAHQVTAGYGADPVLQSVTLGVRAGEFVGLVGPNGCGKSTLLRALSGVLRPQSGEVTLHGRNLRKLSPREIAREMAFVPQVERAAFEFSVHDVVLMGRYPYQGSGNGIGGIGKRRGWTSEDYAHTRRALIAADILHLAERPITQLSGGEHRRTLVARALARDAPLLLLDEPTAHLDITHQVELLELVRGLTRRATAPVGALAALHELNQAAEYCDRLVLMSAGRVAAEGPPEEVMHADLLRQVYGAEAQVGCNPITGRPMILALTPARMATPMPEMRHDGPNGLKP